MKANGIKTVARDRKRILIQRGWSKAGATFLVGKTLPGPILYRLFGEEHGRRQPKDQCVRCGYQGIALDRHHVHGRKHSDETIILCANCHREVHAGEPLERDAS